MNLTHRLRHSSFLLLFLGMPLLFVAPGFTQTTCTDQSPRNLTYLRESPKHVDYNYINATPLVIPYQGADHPWPDAINYQRHVLLRCDQHYHFPIENQQGCPGEPPPAAKAAPTPVPGDWIEVHTVYALQVRSDGECADHLDHDLACCTTPPFVVVAYNAKVGVTGPVDPVIKPPTPYVKLVSEWSGSTTGTDDPTKCKPIPAQWNFALGCEFGVSRNQLQIFPKAHAARPLQSGNLVSPDLTLAGPDPALPNITCKSVETAVISPNTEAQRACAGACSQGALTRFNGEWANIPPPPYSTHAVCTCCAPYRPQ